jgi:AraC-like DNA-binding protein
MPLNWEVEMNDLDKVYSIENDFFLIDNPVIASAYDYPFKLDVNATVASSITVLMPGQILQYEYISEDLEGFFLIMSKHFANSLLTNMQKRYSLRLSFSDNLCISLDVSELESMLDYYDLLKKTQRIGNLSIRREIAKHLTLAFYHALTYQSLILPNKIPQSRGDVLMDRFIKLVEENFREQRDIGFYADRLCLTPKYLSKVIKESSGALAGEWIDNYVVLEAKVLLKSTCMTIQQISDEMNFPSQSFFGKYFKRVVGMSPKEYRGK